MGRGLLAGAAGTAAIEITTYLDMAIRDRPASSLPKETAKAIASRAGVSLDENRSVASGGLLGYVDGLLAGATYGILRSAFDRMPWTVGALGLAAATLVMSEGTATRLGTTDWTTWSAAQWAEDIVPRLVYGSVTALAMESLANDSRAVDAAANGQDRTHVFSETRKNFDI